MKQLLIFFLVLISLQSFGQNSFVGDNSTRKFTVTDTLKTPNIIQQPIDTTTYKVDVVDALGNHFKMYWPTFGGSAVDSIYRTPGKDSIQFTIAGRYHAIKDSTGGGGVKTLNVQYTDVSNSGTSETDLFSYTLPANTLANDGDALEIKYSGNFSTPASATLRFKFGGSSRTLAPSSANEEWRLDINFIRKTSSTARVMVTLASAYNKILTVETYDISSQDFTTTNVIKITGQAGATGQIVAKTARCVYLPAP